MATDLEKRYSQAELEELFDKHELDKKLPLCTRHMICDEEYSPDSVPRKKFSKRRGYRYLDATTGEEVAVVFHYTLPDGTVKRIINRLVIDTKVHEALLR